MQRRGFPDSLVGQESACQCRRPWFDSWVGKIRWRRDRVPTPVSLGFPCGSAGKESTLQCGRPGFDPWVGKISWRRERLPTLVFWPGEFHELFHGVAKSCTQLKHFSGFQLYILKPVLELLNQRIRTVLMFMRAPPS